MKRSSSCRAFSMIEILVSMTVLIIISLMLTQMTQMTSSTWRNTSAKIEQFRSAGDAFEAMARRISQATLNTYWDYDDIADPKKYIRQSDLRFISGNSESLIGSGNASRPGQCIFFQAPLGLVEDRSKYGGLANLLNTWGYYIDFDRDQRPAFLEGLKNPPPKRYRYRLMELMQPSEELNVYSKTSGTPDYDGKEWFTEALIKATPPVRVLAENIIAMVILPKLAQREDPLGTRLSPGYAYDSTVSKGGEPALDSKNQLPPIVQLTLVAIDETSANRITKDDIPPAFDSLLNSLFQDPENYDTDLQSLEKTLADENINYRVFTTNVSIRGAKWTNLKK